MKFNIKISIIYVLTFLYFSALLTNYLANEYDPYYKNQSSISTNENNLYEKEYDLKKDYNEDLTDVNNYAFYLDRNCDVSGNLHDRHKVRWVKLLLLKNIFQFSESLNDTSPYYVNILLHSFLLFFIFFLINKTFSYNKIYNFLILLYVTFIFQQHLGEYSYSVFETFFLSLALYASKQKKIILFFSACVLAVLNRESGFIIVLTWLIFNHKEMKILFLVLLVCLMTFLIANFDLLECLIKPKYFIPLEYQDGQVNFTDLFKSNIFSFTKLMLINFVLPFGMFFYFYVSSKYKNKILVYIALIYLLIFLVAIPIHHVSSRLILLPLIFAALHFKDKAIN